MRTGEQAQQIVLHAVSILVFVDVQVAEALLPGAPCLIEAAQNLDGAEQQVIEIERAVFAQGFFVSLIGARSELAAFVIGIRERFFWRDGVIFRVADPRENFARRIAGIVGAEVPESDFQRRQLLFVIVDGKIAREAQARSFAAKKAHAEGMKGADPRIAPARIGAFEQHANTFAHFSGGFIRKRDSENGAARNALLNQVGDTIGDDARLAGARAGQDEDWPIDGEHSLALLGIQVIKNIHLSDKISAGSALWRRHFSRADTSEQTRRKIVFNRYCFHRKPKGQCVAEPRSISKKNRG